MVKEIVELLEAPADAKAGDVVQVEGKGAPSPDAQLKNRDLWKRVSAELKTNAQLEVSELLGGRLSEYVSECMSEYVSECMSKYVSEGVSSIFFCTPQQDSLSLPCLPSISLSLPPVRYYDHPFLPPPYAPGQACFGSAGQRLVVPSGVACTVKSLADASIG